MAWIAPRTWVAGEVVTAALGNTHWRDNLRYLKGLDGVVTLSDALILPDGAGYYLHIPILTTTQRDALTPTAGMVIYNSTLTAFNKYENGAWRADLGFNSHHGDLSGLTDDDHTQYQKESLLTTAGDLPYATGASTWARLPLGTALQYIRTNAGATAPEWADDPAAGSEHITIFPHAYDSIGQGTWSIYIDPGTTYWMGGVWYRASPADGDNISYKTHLTTGTYSIVLLTETGGNMGILDVDIDGVEVASFDNYTASADFNKRVIATGIVVATSGLKTLRLRVDGKNASSSGYQFTFQFLSLWRTA